LKKKAATALSIGDPKIVDRLNPVSSAGAAVAPLDLAGFGK
jgi:hypothetical protein